MAALFEIECPCHVTFSISRDRLVPAVGRSKVLANEMIRAVAAVLEAVKLCQNEKSLREHSLKPRFTEAEIPLAAKTCGDPGRGPGCKDRCSDRPPIDQTVQPQAESLYGQRSVGFRHHQPGDAVRIGV